MSVKYPNTAVYIQSSQNSKTKNDGSLLSHSNRKYPVSEKKSMKFLTVICIITLLLGSILVVAAVNGWFDKCDITLGSENYVLEDGIITITGESVSPTLKISTCKKIKTIIVGENALQSINNVEICSN